MSNVISCRRGVIPRAADLLRNISKKSTMIELIALMLSLLLISGNGMCSAAPLALSGPDAPVDGSQYTASGGCGSYTWSITKGIINSSGVVTVSGQCGKATITVMDACGQVAVKNVRLPDGAWIQTGELNSPPFNCQGTGCSCTGGCSWVFGCIISTDRVEIINGITKQVGTLWTCSGSNPRSCLTWSGSPPAGKTCDAPNVQLVSNIYNYEWRCSESACVDNDGDGHYAIAANCASGDDLNDSDPAVYPGAADLCGDFKDNNGSGNIDQGCGKGCPANKPTMNVSTGSSTNVMSGNLFHSQTLFATSGGQLPIKVDLNYASLNVYKGALGTGWHHSYELFLVVQADKVFFRSGDGSITAYTLNATGTYTSPASDYSTLTKNSDGSFIIKYRDGLKRNFGMDGKLTSIVDRYGNSISFNYLNDGLTILTDSAQRQVNIYYDTTVTPHRITDITDPATNNYHFDYDPTTGLLSKVTNPLADTQPGTVQGYWAYTYENGRLKTKTDPNNKVTTYFYQPDGRMTGSLDPEGNIDAGLVAGHARTLQYDVSGKTTFTEKDGGLWQYFYNPKTSALNQKIDPNGKITSYAYYADTGFLKAKTEPFYFDTTANKEVYLTTFYNYDSYGNLAYVTDPIDLSIYGFGDAGSVDITKFGTQGYPAWAVKYVYDNNNFDQILSVTDQRDTTPLTTTYTYSTETGGVQVVKVTDPENNVTTYRYNADGTLLSITDAAHNLPVAFTYANGLPSSVTDKNRVTTNFTSYDNNGNIKEIQKRDNTGALIVTTQIDYDALNHPRTVTKTTTDIPPIVTVTKYDYDLAGNLAVYTDPETTPTVKQTKYEYNYNGQVTKIIDPDLKETRFAYGGNGCASCGGGVDKLTEVKDAKQLANNWSGTTYVYDKLGHLEREIDASGKIIRYTYYDNGLVKDKIDASASPEKTLITYEYNNRKQLTKKQVLDSNGSGINETTFSYDLNGNLQTAANKDMSYTFSWYKNGLLKSSTDINNNTISYEYDGAGNRTWMRAPDGMPFYTIYDEANRPNFYYTPAGIFEITYDDAGRRSKQTSGGFSTYYSYDGLDRLTHLLTKNMAGQNFTESVLTYDRAGNRKTRTAPLTEPGVRAVYEYDNLYRLTNTITTYPTSTTSEPYSYDEVGNRLTDPTSATPYSYSEGNQLDAKPGVTYSYDDYGNLKGKIEGTKTFIYSFDNENRLDRVLITEQSGTITTVSFKYDPFDRRIEKKVTTQYPNNPVISAKVQTFLYDGDRILDATDSTWYPTRYVHGFFGVDDVLAAPILVSSAYTCQVYYDKDALGSVIRWNTGTQISYNSFGVPSSTTVSGYAYTGREYDSETGLYYYRARYYDPKIGRFISKDPIGFAGGDANLYAYTKNNPINWIDPWGLYRYTPTAGGPVDNRTSSSLTCFEKCAGHEVTVTAGREGGHSKGSAHETGQACDVGKNSNPWLDKDTAQSCFQECFDQSRSFGQEEGNHYHFQTRPGRGGATGFADGLR